MAAVYSVIIDISLQGQAGQIGTLTGQIDRLDSSLKRVGSTGRSAGGELAKGFDLAKTGVLALAGALAGGGLVGSIIATTAKFQDLRTALQSVYGGVEEGKAAFDVIQKFASTTPFSVEQLTQSFISLKASGLTPTKELLTAFSDAAVNTTDKVRTFDAMTRIVSRSLAGGLGLEELNQIADAGIPVFQILQEKLGKTRLEISEFGKTAEGSRKIIDALISGIQDRYAGSTERLAGNLSVSLNNLQDNIAKLMDTIGSNGLGQAFQEVANNLSNFIEKNQEAAKALGQTLGAAVKIVGGLLITIASNIDLVVAGLAGLAAAKAATMFLSLVTAVRNAGSALAAFRIILASTGIGLIPLAIGAAVAAYLTFKDTIDKYVIVSLKNLGTAITNGIIHLKNIGSTVSIVWNAVKSFLSGNTSAFNGLGQKIDAAKQKTQAYTTVAAYSAQQQKANAAATNQDAAAKKRQADAAAAAAKVNAGWNQSNKDAVAALGPATGATNANAAAVKKAAQERASFITGLKDQVSNLQIEITTLGQSDAAHDSLIMKRDAEKLGIAKQTAELRGHITALQQEKAEKQFAGSFEDYIKNLNNETAALSLNRNERALALALLQQENAAKAAGTALTDKQRAEFERAYKANQAAQKSAQDRDAAEDESARKAIDRQKELQGEIGNTSTAYGRASNSANNFFSQGSGQNIGQNLGDIISGAIFGGSNAKSQTNNAVGSIADQLVGAIFGTNSSRSYSGSSYNSGSTYMPSYSSGSTSYNGSSSSYSTYGNRSSIDVNINIKSDGQLSESSSRAIAQTVRDVLTDEQRPNGLLWR